MKFNEIHDMCGPVEEFHIFRTEKCRFKWQKVRTLYSIQIFTHQLIESQRNQWAKTPLIFMTFKIKGQVDLMGPIRFPNPYL